MKQIWIYDIEQWINFHCCSFINPNTNETKTFIIHKETNQLQQYYEFLTTEVSGLIGYNCIGYDYPMIHYILQMYKVFKYYSSDNINQRLYNESQRLINTEYSHIIEDKVKIPQLDLFLLHHFNNKNKYTSLKYLEINTRFENVEDIPFDHNYIVQNEDVETIVKYNINDCMATLKLYEITQGKTEIPNYKGKDMIEFRRDMSKLYGVNIFNMSDVKIGEELNKIGYLKNTGKSWGDIKNLRTNRTYIKIKDLIPDYIEFKDKSLIKLLSLLEKDIINVNEPKVEHSFIFAQNKWKFALGGIHTEDKGRIVIPDSTELYVEKDVGSMYPNKIISKQLYPEHLGIEWLINYTNNKNRRLELKRLPIKTSSQVLEIETIKLALNGGGYGKTGESTNWQYDPLVKYTTTIQCQLDILYLADLLYQTGLIKIESGNTDGINIIYKKDDEEIIDNICKGWEEITNAELETTYYKKLVRSSVNDYMALKYDNSIKLKGDFEIDKELHKNSSMRIVPIALKEYYINNIPVEITIRNHTDIYDFCIAEKFPKPWYGEFNYLENNEKKIIIFKKNIRYYVSTKGSYLWKINKEDGRIIQLESGYSIIPFNRYIEKTMQDYNINYNYYIKEVNKIINTINNGQLTLF